MSLLHREMAVVAVSGGMDSCVTAAIANENFELAFAHINYGQRTEKRELKAFYDIADYFGVNERLVVDYSHLSKIGGSSLTDKNIAVSKADLSNKRNLPAVGRFQHRMFRSEMRTYFQLVLAGQKF